MFDLFLALAAAAEDDAPLTPPPPTDYTAESFHLDDLAPRRGLPPGVGSQQELDAIATSGSVLFGGDLTAKIVVDAVVPSGAWSDVVLTASKSVDSDIEFVGDASAFSSEVLVSSRNDIVVATGLNSTGALHLVADSDCDGAGELVVSSLAAWAAAWSTWRFKRLA